MAMRLSEDQLARMRAADEARREAAAEVRVGGAVLKPSQRVALAEAERLASGGLEERRKAAALVRAVEAELRAARDGVIVQDGVVDTLARAEARGEMFEVEAAEVGEWRRDGHGALVRIKGQPILDVKTVRRARRVDGLASLHRAGRLSDRQMETGRGLRSLFQAIMPPVGAASLEPVIGASWSDPEAPMAAAVQRGFDAEALSDMLALLTPAQVRVLHAVVARGLTLGALAGGGRRWQANHLLLTQALDATDLPFRKWRNSSLRERNAKCI